MSGSPKDSSPFGVMRRRFTPLGFVMLALIVVVVLWSLLQVWLHLLGIAASPLGWILSLLGTLVGLATARGG